MLQKNRGDIETYQNDKRGCSNNARCCKDINTSSYFFAGTLYLALMRNIMEEPSETHITAEEPSETNITAEELIRREYGDCAFSMIKHLYLMESCIDISTIKMVSFMFFMKRMSQTR